MDDVLAILFTGPCKPTPEDLLLFAIKMATLPFWAEIKNLRTPHCKPHKIANPGRINTIVSDLERYDIGLLEYVKI